MPACLRNLRGAGLQEQPGNPPWNHYMCGWDLGHPSTLLWSWDLRARIALRLFRELKTLKKAGTSLETTDLVLPLPGPELVGYSLCLTEPHENIPASHEMGSTWRNPKQNTRCWHCCSVCIMVHSCPSSSDVTTLKGPIIEEKSWALAWAGVGPALAAPHPGCVTVSFFSSLFLILDSLSAGGPPTFLCCSPWDGKLIFQWLPSLWLPVYSVFPLGHSQVSFLSEYTDTQRFSATQNEEGGETSVTITEAVSVWGLGHSFSHLYAMDVFSSLF